MSKDKIRTQILSLINSSLEPLETKEIEVQLKHVSRVKILYRLNILRGDGLINGKALGSGKGAWVWWKKQTQTPKQIKYKKDSKEEVRTNILSLITNSTEPFETKEIEAQFKGISRSKIFYRLMLLRGDNLIAGKQIGSGKGTWIWWSKKAFEK